MRASLSGAPFRGARRSPRCRRRAGNFLVLTGVLMVVMLAVVAFAIDIGCLCVARQELQRSSDAAALAAAWELIGVDAPVTDEDDASQLAVNARTEAGRYAGLNPILTSSPVLGEPDVTVGYLADLSDTSLALDTSGMSPPNAAEVFVRRTAGQNGEVPFFLARALGLDSSAAQANAVAAFTSGVKGFCVPPDESPVCLLPFTLDLPTWESVNAEEGAEPDNWVWDRDTETVTYSPGGDGRREVNLYPNSDAIGLPGNRGTVDIGGSNNSTMDIARQILEGVSKADLEHHGGSLTLDEWGQLELNGDTGISAGIKDELESIIGEPRVIPIFSQAVNPGDNAQYTIVKFCGIVITDVKLTGPDSKKHVTIQPCKVVCKGCVPGSGSDSDYVYSPPWLVR